jgi:hypothetical protein
MPDVLAHLDDYGLYVAGVVAGLTALGFLLKGARRLIRWAVGLGRTIDALNDLAQYELRPNHGGSLKDHAAQVPPLVGRVDALAEQVAGQRRILDEHLLASTSEQQSMWSAIEAIAKASPPEE